MPLDPKCRILIDALAPPGAPGLEDMSVAEARQLMVTRTEMAGAGEPVAHVEDRVVRMTRRSPLPCRRLSGRRWTRATCRTSPTTPPP